MPTEEQQRQYRKLSAQLQAIGLHHKSELPSGATSLLMKVNSGKVGVEVFDRKGKLIGTIPGANTSSALWDELQRTFDTRSRLTLTA